MVEGERITLNEIALDPRLFDVSPDGAREMPAAWR